MVTKSEKDLSDTIVAKSDQLNSDDLLSGPIVVTITGVRRSADEQPVVVDITGGFKPWKPCKTTRRVLVHAWGKDGSQWVGKTLKLYRDPSVKWAGEAVGGIRIAAMSHIHKSFEIALAESRKSKKKTTIEKLEPQQQQPSQQKPALDVAGMFAAWKAAREANHQPADQTSLRAFVETATGGAITAENALRSANYTPQLLAVCLSEVAKISPPDVNESDELPFGDEG